MSGNIKGNNKLRACKEVDYMYKGGYAGKILRIDLTKQAAKEEPLPEEIVKNYLGGAGFAIKYIYDEVKAGTPALGEDNKLIFAIGPLTATGATRQVVVPSPTSPALL